MTVNARYSGKKLLSGFALFAALTVFVYSSAFAEDLKEGEYYALSILHTNDSHGHVDKLPQYATLIKQTREQAKNTIVLDGGDLFLRGEFDGLSGEPEMKMFNEMAYDAWVIGNNDFNVPEKDHTPHNPGVPEKLIKTAKAPTLCANVLDKKTGKLLEGVKPYVIKEVNGVKVGIIGVTSVKPQDRGYEPGKTFLDPVATLNKYVEELKGKTDVNIVISHCGLSEDVKISYEVAGISALLGADDHFRMEKPIYWVWEGEKSIPIVQHGGEEEHILGSLELVFQKKDGALKLVDFRGDALSTDFVKGDKKVQDVIDEYREMKQASEMKKAA